MLRNCFHMRLFVSRACVCGVLALGMAAATSVSGGEQLELADVVAAVRAAEQGLRTVWVRRVKRYEPEMPANPRFWDGAMEQEIWLEDIGRVDSRMALVMRYVDYQSKTRVEQRVVWDGTSYRWLSDTRRPSGDGGAKAGVIKSQFQGIVGGSPADCLWWYMGYPLSGELEQSKVTGLHQRHHAGRRIVIELKPHEDVKMEYHLAPEMGFAMVYRARFAPSPDGSGGWQRIAELKCSDLREVRAGLWLPHRVQERWWLDITGPSTQVTLATVSTLEWNVDAQPDASTFSLEFPPGTLVDDTIRGKRYRIATVTDQDIADQVAAARRLAQEQGEQPATGASARMVFAACLAALAAGGMIAYRIKRRRKAA